MEWKYCISSILGHILPTPLKLEYILKRDGFFLKKKKKAYLTGSTLSLLAENTGVSCKWWCLRFKQYLFQSE